MPEIKENIEIKIDNPEKELTIIHKNFETEKISYPIKINIEGNIKAPADYAAKRKALLDKDKVIITVDIVNNCIILHENVMNEYAAKITGKFDDNPDLLEFRINSNKSKFKIQDLITFLRFRKHLFRNVDEHKLIIDKLSNLKVHVNTEFERVKTENKGNYKVFFEQKMKTDIDINFDIELPLFVGSDKSFFKCFLGYDIREGELDYWFESDELMPIIESEKERIINEQIKRLSDYLIIYL